MFLQLMTLLVAVQWLGAPWQLGWGKGILAVFFFYAMIGVSIIPSMFREWGNFKKNLVVCCIIQLGFSLLNFIIPGAILMGLGINLILCFVFTGFVRKVVIGFSLFIVWFAGINYLLGLNILEDPRGYFSGDVFLTFTDWALLAGFFLALLRAIYHGKTNYYVFVRYESKEYDISTLLALTASATIASAGFSVGQEERANKMANKILFKQAKKTAKNIPDDVQGEIKGAVQESLKQSLEAVIGKDAVGQISSIAQIDALNPEVKAALEVTFKETFGGALRLFRENTNTVNLALQRRERKTFAPVMLCSIVLLGVSFFIKPQWKAEAIEQLATGYSCYADGDREAADKIASIYYNDERILYNGDVFLLKGMTTLDAAPDEASPLFNKAAQWFDHHKSWINSNHHGEAYYYLAQSYTQITKPNYKKASKALKQALALEPMNEEYNALQDSINAKTAALKAEKPDGFFKKLFKSLFNRGKDDDDAEDEDADSIDVKTATLAEEKPTGFFAKLFHKNKEEAGDAISVDEETAAPVEEKSAGFFAKLFHKEKVGEAISVDEETAAPAEENSVGFFAKLFHKEEAGDAISVDEETAASAEEKSVGFFTKLFHKEKVGEAVSVDEKVAAPAEEKSEWFFKKLFHKGTEDDKAANEI
jgi:hypothetical protein